MPTNFDDMIKKFSPARRRRIEARAKVLIAEELTLQSLRRARQLTQGDMAKILKTDQGSVSRLESRTDMLISTLRHVVARLGGELHLIGKFSDRPPVELVGFAEEKGRSRKREKAKKVA